MTILTNQEVNILNNLNITTTLDKEIKKINETEYHINNIIKLGCLTKEQEQYLNEIDLSKKKEELETLKNKFQTTEPTPKEPTDENSEKLEKLFNKVDKAITKSKMYKKKSNDFFSYQESLTDYTNNQKDELKKWRLMYNEQYNENIEILNTVTKSIFNFKNKNKIIEDEIIEDLEKTISDNTYKFSKNNKETIILDISNPLNK